MGASEFRSDISINQSFILVGKVQPKADVCLQLRKEIKRQIRVLKIIFEQHLSIVIY